jgi:hypothetical protein
VGQQPGNTRGTVAGQVSQDAKPPGTVESESNHALNPSVPLSQPLGRGTLGQCQKSGTVPWDTAGTPATYVKVFSALLADCPAHIDAADWQRAIDDSRKFLASWGEQAEALGWTAQELFGLHPVPAKPHPSFQRLARYDSTGLVWLLHGRPVVGMTADSAVIRTVSGGTVVYRKLNKPALGPFGDSLDDMGAAT